MAGIPLVTGATGFAGGHLVAHLLEHEPRVAAWGHAGGRALPGAGGADRVLWSAVDITEPDAVASALAELQPSAVFHCAGIADVHGSWSDSASALRVNAFGTHAIFRGLARAGVRVPVLVTGSALVYRASAAALGEDSAIGPASPYALSKLAQEMVALDSAADAIVARPFNHAGPRQSAAYVTSSFARQIAEAEAGLREAVLRVGNLDARRDITDVRDTVRAYRLLIECGSRGGAYNVCRGEAYRVGDLMQALVQRSTVPIRVEIDPARLRPSDNPIVLGDPRRIQADTGWRASIPIERTLQDLLDYWRAAVGHTPA